jgi:asparagine synthase (glutamine-hydrolysing)
VVVIDANDIGRNVMGQATDRPDRFFEEVFADNPLGQGNERTPLCVVAPVPLG